MLITAKEYNLNTNNRRITHARTHVYYLINKYNNNNLKHNDMKRVWKFRNKEYTMIFLSYGSYSLNGYHCTDGYIWDYVTDNEDIKRRGQSRRYAELFVKRHESNSYY